MKREDTKDNAESGDSKADPKADPKADSKANDNPPQDAGQVKELGGRGGLDPTRYGDWEKAGRCIDF